MSDWYICGDEGVRGPVIAGTPAYQGPLDVAPSTPAIIWGGLFAYSAAACGTKAIRLIRADTTQADISTLANGSLNVSDPFFNGSTYKVVTIYDQANPGGSQDFTQGTDANRPTFTLAGLNSKPSILFSAGGTTWLQATLAAAQNQAFVQGWVGSYANTVAGASYVWGDDVSGVGCSFQGSVAGTLVGMAGGSALNGGGSRDTNPHAVLCVWNSTGSVIAVDGADVTTGDAGTRGLAINDTLDLGIQFVGANNVDTMNIGEVGLWAGDLVATRFAIGANMKSRWGF